MRPTPPRRCPDRTSRGRTGLAGRSVPFECRPPPRAPPMMSPDLAAQPGIGLPGWLRRGAGKAKRKPAPPCPNMSSMAAASPPIMGMPPHGPCGKPRAMSANARSSLALPWSTKRTRRPAQLPRQVRCPLRLIVIRGGSFQGGWWGGGGEAAAGADGTGNRADRAIWIGAQAPYAGRQPRIKRNLA